MERSSNDKGANNVGDVYQTRSCDFPSGIAGSDVGNREHGCDDSDKRYWPSEVGPSAYGAVSTQHAPRDAFAAISRTASPAVASAPAEEDTWHYVGGPKSSIAPSRGF
jgi:hypothetical protein